MKRQIILVLITILIVSCNSSPSYVDEVENEMKKIKSIKGHKLFLNKIYDDSQAIVEEIKILEKNFFLNKSKVKKMNQKLDSLMPQNIYRVEKYLNSFSYPSNKKFTEEETLAIYHAIYNNKLKAIQLRFLPELEQAYENKIVDKYKYIGYLSKVYYLSTSNFYSFDKRQSYEEMIAEISSEIQKIQKIQK